MQVAFTRAAVERVQDGFFELTGRNALAATGLSPTLLPHPTDIIRIPAALPGRECMYQRATTVGALDQSVEHSWLQMPADGPVTFLGRTQEIVHLAPELGVDDGRLFAAMSLALVADVPTIEHIVQ